MKFCKAQRACIGHPLLVLMQDKVCRIVFSVVISCKLLSEHQTVFYNGSFVVLLYRIGIYSADELFSYAVLLATLTHFVQ